jgi:hypothetical protein
MVGYLGPLWVLVTGAGNIVLKPNYAFKPIAELALRSNQTIVPQRLNAALAINDTFPGVS